MARVPTGDSGDWNLGSGIKPLPSVEERCRQSMTVVSPEVKAAMAAETAFLATVTGKPDTKRFTDRRPIPGRGREVP